MKEKLSERNKAAGLGLTHLGQNTRLGPSSTHKLAVMLKQTEFVETFKTSFATNSGLINNFENGILETFVKTRFRFIQI